MSARSDRLHVTRKIYFYRINAGRNLAGELILYNLESALKVIQGLDFKTDAGYLRDDGGFDICGFVDEQSSLQKVRFCKIIRDDLPQIERQGNLADLELAEKEGLAHCVHVVFFPDNIVGLEYNYNGPTVTRICEYLHEKTKNVCPKTPVFEHLVHPDTIARLKHMKTVRRFRIKVRPSLLNSVEQADESLAATFRSARDLAQAKEIELSLSVGHAGRKETLGTKLIDVATTLVTLKDTNNDVISAEINGYNDTGKIDLVDLLSAKLIAIKNIPRRRGRTNAPPKELVYAAIEEAYNEFKDQFPNALGVTLCPV